MVCTPVAFLLDGVGLESLDTWQPERALQLLC